MQHQEAATNEAGQPSEEQIAVLDELSRGINGAISVAMESEVEMPVDYLMQSIAFQLVNFITTIAGDSGMSEEDAVQIYDDVAAHVRKSISPRLGMIREVLAQIKAQEASAEAA